MATKKIYVFIKPLISIVFVSLLTTGAGCKKFVEIGPPRTSINEENVYSNNSTAAGVLTSIYTELSNQNFSASLSFSTGLTGDELNLLDLNEQDFFLLLTNQFSISQDMTNVQADYWNTLYPLIYTSNAALEGLTASTSLTPAVKQQLLGEARFMRAFFYFYLVNFYGDVPLTLSTDHKINSKLPRTAKADIYKQIITDLKEAISFLSENYVGADAVTVGSGIERVRPNKWAAAALLARVYLYTGDFKNAEIQATEVINHNQLYHLETLDRVFLRESAETIWALQVVNMENNVQANTEEGRKYILPALANMNLSFTLDLNIPFVERFVVNDQRAVHWIGTYSDGSKTYFYPNKYKVGWAMTKSTEYPVLIRLGELYLIRAEARIRQGNISDGIADLNILRTRATDLTAGSQGRLSQLPLDASKDQALHMLEYERMAELFTEGAHRWFDLKRTPDFTNASITRADKILGALKENWKSTAQLFPIPLQELLRNPNLTGHQNPGYGN